jgi:hypothetical protein
MTQLTSQPGYQHSGGRRDDGSSACPQPISSESPCHSREYLFER